MMSKDLQGMLFSKKSKVQVTVTSYISNSLPHIQKKEDWKCKSVFIFVFIKQKILESYIRN